MVEWLELLPVERFKADHSGACENMMNCGIETTLQTNPYPTKKFV